MTGPITNADQAIEASAKVAGDEEEACRHWVRTDPLNNFARGHPYSGDNLVVRMNGPWQTRMCRECQRMINVRHRAKRRARALADEIDRALDPAAGEGGE